VLQPEPLEEIEKLLRPYGPALPVAELVEEINRLFHDVHAADYDTVHPEIFAQLPSLWAEMTELAMANLAGSRLRVLDFGAGTGFASEQILRHVPSEYIERLTCYDLSEKMLAVCRSKIDRLFPSASYCANFEVLNSNPSSGPYNVLLTNSVLHHLADPVGAIEKLHPVLSAGAVWLAGHEPSSRFFANEECRKHFERFKWTKLLVPRNYLEKLRPLVKPTGYEGVAAAATSNGMFRRMPPGRVISRLVDLRVAYSAQEAAAGFGMDFEKLAVDFAETWQLKWVRTYSFMGDIYESNVPSIVRRRCREVELKFPRDGSNFCAVWTRATQKILLGPEEGPTH
jgi:ubiquinone/menaquinone biosynthesis C-methylase UbiE